MTSLRMTGSSGFVGQVFNLSKHLLVGQVFNLSKHLLAGQVENLSYGT